MDLVSGLFGKGKKKPPTPSADKKQLQKNPSSEKKPISSPNASHEKVKDDWRDEISKARKGLFICVINSTRRDLKLKESKILSGKASSGCTIGLVVQEDNNELTFIPSQDSRKVPPLALNSFHYLEFGSMSTTMLTGTEGALTYKSYDRPEIMKLTWNLPKLGKEKAEAVCEEPFQVTVQENWSKNYITFVITEKRTEKDFETMGLLSSSLDFDLRNSTEVRVQKEFKEKQVNLVSGMTKEEGLSELTTLRLSLCEEFADVNVLALDTLDRYITFALESSQPTCTNQADPALIDQLVNEDLPAIVKHLLARRVKESHVRKTIQKFFCRVLELALVLASPSRLGLVGLIKTIVRPEHYFYSVGDSVPFQIRDRTLDVLTCREYQAVFNHFLINCKALERLLSLIQSTQDLAAIQKYLAVVSEVKNHLKKDEDFQIWVLQVKEYIFQMVEKMPVTTFKEANDDALHSLLTTLEGIMQQVASRKDAADTIHTFRMQLILKYIRTDSLSKRVRGFRDLNTLINQATREKSLYSMATESHFNKLDSEKLCEWVVQNDIVTMMFDPQQSHVELLRRYNLVFFLLAKHNKLQTTDLDRIWQMGHSKSKEEREAVYLILKDVADEQNLADLLYVLGKVTRLPLSEYSVPLLKLVKALAENSVLFVKSNNPRKYDPHHELWRFIQAHSHETSVSVANIAMDFLYTLLKEENGTMKKVFLKLCLENIRASRNVSRSLFLFTKIAETFSRHEFRSKEDTMQVLIETLELEEGMTDSFFLDFSRFCETQSQPEEHQFFRQVKDRLDFLTFIFMSSSLSLNPSQADILWKLAVTSTSSLNIRDLYMGWLAHLIDQRRVLQPKIIQYIFDKQLCGLAPLAHNMISFNCFQTFFKAVNRAEAKMDQEGRVLDESLFGIRSIWEIALQTTDPAVAYHSGIFLNMLYDSLGPKLAKKKNQIQHNFVQIIRDLLRKAHDTHDTQQIKGCLRLLHMFVKSNNTKSAVRDENMVTFKLYPATNSKCLTPYIFIQGQVSETYNHFRSRAIPYIRHLFPTAKKVCLLKDGKKIGEKQKSLQKLGFSPEHVIYFTIKEHVREEKERVEELPSTLLCNETEMIDLLFELFPHPEFSQTVGNILQLLPGNPKMIQEIHENKGVEWQKLLPFSTSLFQSLYTLQYIEAILFERSTEQTEELARQQWGRRFVETNGLSYLYASFFSFSVKPADPENNSVVRSLLGIMAFFILDTGHGNVELRQGVSTMPWFDAEKLLSGIVTLIWGAAGAQSELVQTNGEIVKQATKFLLALISANPARFQILYNFSESLHSFVVRVLLETPNQAIRQIMAESLSKLVTEMPKPPVDMKIPDFAKSLMDILVTLLPSVVNFLDCEEYFDTLNAIIRYDNNTEHCQGLLNQVLMLIEQHPVLEKFDKGKEDKLLIGLMDIVLTFVQMNPLLRQKLGPKMVPEVFECIFEQPKDLSFARTQVLPPKCKTKLATATAFALLLELSKESDENMGQINQLIKKNHLQHQFSEWNFSPATDEISGCGYVGLRNMGCTCYMNSLLQQFYMTRDFRNGILAWKSDLPQHELADSVLYQLQRMFAALRESRKQFYDTESFVFSFKDYDNQPTNPTIQMDVDEFFNRLCEKLEAELKPSKQSQLLQRMWGGTTVTQLLCQEGCKHEYEHEDSFFTISLDIKGKNNIEDALREYCKGERLVDNNAYHCGICNAKRNTLKRSLIKGLPETLILTLKRFEFNLDTMRKNKVNTYCSFPQTLDIFPFTKDGFSEINNTISASQTLNSNNHSNTKKDNNRDHSNNHNIEDSNNHNANEKSNNSKLSKKEEEDNQQTEEAILDDEDQEPPVSPSASVTSSRNARYRLVGILVHEGSADSGHYYSFIKERGTGQSRWLRFEDKLVSLFHESHIEQECFGGSEYIPQYSGYTTELQEKTRSAYMLFYERIQTKVTLAPTSQQTRSPALSIDDSLSVETPHALQNEIWEENVRFLRTKRLFNQNYFKFLIDILEYTHHNSENMIQYPQILETVTTFFLSTAVRARDKTSLSKFSTEIQSLVSIYPKYASWILAEFSGTKEKKGYFWGLAIQCPVKEVREEMKAIVSASLKSISRKEKEFALTWLQQISREALGFPAKTFGPVFGLLTEFANFGVDERRMLVDSGLLWEFSSALQNMQAQHPAASTFAGDFMPLFSLCATSFATKIKEKKPPPTFQEKFALPLTPEIQEKFLCEPVLFKAIQSDAQGVAQIVIHFCWGNEHITEKINAFLIDSLFKAEVASLNHFFDLIRNFQVMDDSLHKKRIKGMWPEFFDRLSKCKDEKDNVTRAKTIIQLVKRIHDSNEDIRSWFGDHPKAWSWIQQWYREH